MPHTTHRIRRGKHPEITFVVNQHYINLTRLEMQLVSLWPWPQMAVSWRRPNTVLKEWILDFTMWPETFLQMSDYVAARLSGVSIVARNLNLFLCCIYTVATAHSGKQILSLVKCGLRVLRRIETTCYWLNGKQVIEEAQGGNSGKWAMSLVSMFFPFKREQQEEDGLGGGRDDLVLCQRVRHCSPGIKPPV